MGLNSISLYLFLSCHSKSLKKDLMKEALLSIHKGKTFLIWDLGVHKHTVSPENSTLHPFDVFFVDKTAYAIIFLKISLNTNSRYFFVFNFFGLNLILFSDHPPPMIIASFFERQLSITFYLFNDPEDNIFRKKLRFWLFQENKSLIYLTVLIRRHLQISSPANILLMLSNKSRFLTNFGATWLIGSI